MTPEVALWDAIWKKQSGCVSKCVQHSCATTLKILIQTPEAFITMLIPPVMLNLSVRRGYKVIHQCVFVGKSYTLKKKTLNRPCQVKSLDCGFCFSGWSPLIDSGLAVALTDCLDFPLVHKQLQPMLIFLGGTEKLIKLELFCLLPSCLHLHPNTRSMPGVLDRFHRHPFPSFSAQGPALFHCCCVPHTTWSINLTNQNIVKFLFYNPFSSFLSHNYNFRYMF